MGGTEYDAHGLRVVRSLPHMGGTGDGCVETEDGTIWKENHGFRELSEGTTGGQYGTRIGGVIFPE